VAHRTRTVQGWARWSCAVSACLWMAACGGGGGGGTTCTSPPDVAGTWSGVINDSRAGGGTLTVVFDQTDCALAGQWQTAYANPASNGSGTVSGTAEQTTVSFTLLTQAPGACGYQVNGTLQGTNEIQGTFSTVGNNCASTGSLDVTRRVTPTPVATATATPEPTPTS
jgi:hypothetical protein